MIPWLYDEESETMRIDMEYLAQAAGFESKVVVWLQQRGWTVTKGEADE